MKSRVGEFPLFIKSDLITYLQHRCDTFEAGYITHCLQAWKRITNDREIISTVTGLKIDFHTTPTQHYNPHSKRTYEETRVIDSEIQKLLAKKVIEPIEHSENEIISEIFAREKKDSTFRMILNLKNLNEFTTKLHFKMATLTMASIDLKDAYYSVPVAKQHSAYLRFIWREQLYQFTCMPNGLSCAPRQFTKLLKPALSELHTQGHISSGYIDDIYLQGKTYPSCVSNVLFYPILFHPILLPNTVTQFDSLGLIAHPTKSAFNPTQQLEILGFVINSVEMTITLTQRKASKLFDTCQELLNNPSPTIREVACGIGKIVASFPVVMYGPLHYRHLEHDKTNALQNSHWNFDKHMTLSLAAKEELTWWTTHVLDSHNVISRAGPSHTLTTDASNEGWGAVVLHSSTGGL